MRFTFSGTNEGKNAVAVIEADTLEQADAVMQLQFPAFQIMRVLQVDDDDTSV